MALSRGLGRGLDSLIPTAGVEAQFDVTAKVDEKTGERVSADTVRSVDPELIDPTSRGPSSTRRRSRRWRRAFGCTAYCSRWWRRRRGRATS